MLVFTPRALQGIGSTVDLRVIGHTVYINVCVYLGSITLGINFGLMFCECLSYIGKRFATILHVAFGGFGGSAGFENRKGMAPVLSSMACDCVLQRTTAHYHV